VDLPEQVRAGMSSFRHQSASFFDGYAASGELAQAA
jgi:hypothetical protein